MPTRASRSRRAWRPRCPGRPACPPRFEEKTTSSPSLRTFGWMSFAAASFSPATGDEPAEVPAAEPSAHVDVARNHRRARSRRTGKRRRRSRRTTGPARRARCSARPGRSPRLRGSRPAVSRVVAREVDVSQPAASRQRLPAHEEEAAAPNRGRAEVVRGRVDRLTEVLGRAPGIVLAVTAGDPDVEQADAARAGSRRCTG